MLMQKFYRKLSPMALLLFCGWGAAPGACFAEAQTADDYQILRVTTDAVAGNLDLKLTLDSDHNISSIKYLTPKAQQTFDLAGISQGVVMFARSGFNVVTLKSQDFDPKSGGTLTLTYLYDGLNDDYRDFPMELHRDGDTWALYSNDSAGRQSFSSMYMLSNRVFGQIVGISAITVQ